MTQTTQPTTPARQAHSHSAQSWCTGRRCASHKEDGDIVPGMRPRCRSLALATRPYTGFKARRKFFGPGQSPRNGRDFQNFRVSDVSRKFGPEKRGEGGRERERKREEKERGEGKRREERERESERLHARVRSHQVIDNRLWTYSILSSGFPCLTIRPHKHVRLSERQGSVLTVRYTTLGITLVSLCCLPHPSPTPCDWRQ